MMGFKEPHFSPLKDISLEDLVPKDNFYPRLQSAPWTSHSSESWWPSATLPLLAAPASIRSSFSLAVGHVLRGHPPQRAPAHEGGRRSPEHPLVSRIRL
jgi:hypothetical protein